MRLAMDWSLMASILRRAVVIDDLDVVAVGVEDEGGVVAGVVARALAGLAVAPIAGVDGSLIKALYVAVVVGPKRHREVRGRGTGDERERAARAAELHAVALVVVLTQA